MAEHFFSLFADQLGKDFVSIAPETMQRLMAHSWPGNVRELQGIVKQTLLKASGPVIVPAFLPSGFGESSSPGNNVEISNGWESEVSKEINRRLASGSCTVSEDIHNEVDRILIREVMKATGNNLSEASLRLGISRPTLRSRMKHLRLKPE